MSRHHRPVDNQAKKDCVSVSTRPMFHAVVMDADSEGEECEPVPSPSLPATVVTDTVTTKNDSVSVSSRPMFHAVVMDTDSEGEECEPVPSPSLPASVATVVDTTKNDSVSVSSRPMFHAVVTDADSEGEECEPVPSPSVPSTFVTGTNQAKKDCVSISRPMFHAVVMDTDSEEEECEPVLSPSTVVTDSDDTKKDYASVSTRPMFHAVVMDTDSKGDECEPVPSSSLPANVVTDAVTTKNDSVSISSRPMFYAVVMDADDEELHPSVDPPQSSCMVNRSIVQDARTRSNISSPSSTVPPLLNARPQPDARPASLSRVLKPHPPHSPLLQRRGKPIMSVKIRDRTDGVENGAPNLLSHQGPHHTASSNFAGLFPQTQLNVPNPTRSANTLRTVHTEGRRPDRRLGLEKARPPKRGPVSKTQPQVGGTPSAEIPTAINRGACHLSLRDLEPSKATLPPRSQSDPLTPSSPITSDASSSVHSVPTPHSDVVIHIPHTGLTDVTAKPRRGSWPRHKSHKQLPSTSFPLIQEEEEETSTET